MNAVPLTPTLMQRWQRFSKASVRGFHVYASWLVSISWKRFVVLSILLLVGTNILQDLPPFTWRVTEQVEGPSLPKLPKLPKASTGTKLPPGVHYEVKIDKHGVRIVPSTAASGAEPQPGVEINLPDSISERDIRAAAEQAKQALDALAEQARAAQESAEEVRDEARQALEEVNAAGSHTRTRVVHLGDFLVNLAVFIILASGVIKVTYKGRIQAEVKAAQAEETAEAESLKRQVIEARMAAMQAQVEPHFLFNTLASIDHLIETDPPRASQMQRNLIALLRASMPTMREANAGGVRDLGREMSVIKPYLEILKVRMEERLQTEIDVPEGLMSAEFPPMMIQSLVENAIKHGLEPKAEGGSLKVKAEIVHGKLAVTVADTGLGFGRAATAGTGVGLANIRERLMLLYGSKGGITVTENQPSGTIVTITVPYRSREQGA
jgi:signal transduction histidine kinase